MITTKKTIEINRLEITQGNNIYSPRDWSNLGYFITVDRNRYSPDNNEELENIIKETGNEATSQEEHIKTITERIENELNEKVIKIYPVVKYEHGNIYYELGTQHGFDCSNTWYGFYIITDKTQKKIGTSPEYFEKVIKGELENYNSWVNGEVYSYILYNDKGEEVDCCGGFYDIEDIREYLPEEFKNEDLKEYFKN